MIDFENIKIVRSSKRRKTVSAQLLNGVMIVQAPARMPENQLNTIIQGFKVKFIKKRKKLAIIAAEDISKVADRLNKKYFDGNLKINSIKYVTNQNKRYGCCNCREKTIRVSHQLTKMPAWVRDYVIIHELAHLLEPNHSKAFWDIVNRYKYTERAKGYLLAHGMIEDEADW
ncbi:MAG: M48 family metallopeptidase [Candidatus Margulisiibacteriota bacterium]